MTTGGADIHRGWNTDTPEKGRYLQRVKYSYPLGGADIFRGWSTDTGEGADMWYNIYRVGVQINLRGGCRFMIYTAVGVRTNVTPVSLSKIKDSWGSMHKGFRDSSPG